MQIEVDGLQAGESVRVSFRLPVSEVAVEATASVVWVNPNRQGIRFTNISEQDQQAIRTFVGEEHG
jgi:hypothetical protein